MLVNTLYFCVKRQRIYIPQLWLHPLSDEPMEMSTLYSMLYYVRKRVWILFGRKQILSNLFTVKKILLSLYVLEKDQHFLHFKPKLEVVSCTGQSHRHLSTRKWSPAGHFDWNRPALASVLLMAYSFLLNGLTS